MIASRFKEEASLFTDKPPGAASELDFALRQETGASSAGIGASAAGLRIRTEPFSCLASRSVPGPDAKIKVFPHKKTYLAIYNICLSTYQGLPVITYG